MDWFLLVGVLVLVLIMLLWMGRRSPSPPTKELTLEKGDVWLPSNTYYGSMLYDTELEGRPLLDVAIPLPTFYVHADGMLSVVELYNHDYEKVIGGKRLSIGNVRGSVAVGGLLQAFLLSSLADTKDLRVLKWYKKEAYGVQATVQVEEEVHDFHFTLLPLAHKPSPPRRAVKNVGYFSQPLVVAHQQIDIIQRYQRPTIIWQPAPSIPREWYPELEAALDYWNRHLQKVNGPSLVFRATPWLGDPYTASVNLFCLARSSGYIGVGTSVTDSRSGEYLWSRVNLDPNMLDRNAYLFPGTEENHLYLLRYATIHEVGHTLGLRHNFVAQVDNNSSYMAYLPSWYPTADGKLHFLTDDISGDYDELAISYGYTSFQMESPLHVPATLQGQIDKYQHLFHTDENVDQDRILSHAHRHTMKGALAAPSKWMRAFTCYRPLLFQDPTEHLRDVRRTVFFLNSITEAVTNASTYVSGYTTDYRRQKLEIDDHTSLVLEDTVEFLIGETWRLGRIEDYLTSATIDPQGRLIFTERPWQGSYTIDKAQVASLHSGAVVEVARALLIPQRVVTLTNPGAFLLQLLTTPGSLSRRPILGKEMDALHLQALMGIFATVEYYRDSYSPLIQASLDTVMDHVIEKLKGEEHRSLMEGVVRTVRRLQEKLVPKDDEKKCGRASLCGCRHACNN